MPQSSENWPAILEGLLAGDRVAFMHVNRQISRVLGRLRAYDFHDDWDDLRQEVVIAVMDGHRAGRLRDSDAFLGYLRVITRNKYMDRLRRLTRCKEKETLAWEDVTDKELASIGAARTESDDATDIWREVGKLPDRQQRVLRGLYREGRTYQEVSDETGIPLGTLKRTLREALAVLRDRFAEVGSLG